MSKGKNITANDVLQILKFVVLVIAVTILFIIWENIDGVTNIWARIGILIGTEIVTPVLIILAVKSLLVKGTDWSIRAGAIIYSFVGIVGVFCEISYLADNWHWSAWPIFLSSGHFRGLRGMFLLNKSSRF